ncbi:P-loop NTPase fold protein [Streptomyces sp. ID05-26A]|nr:P-loop NTPase fold protein [Streptomyces sp. ID05-26A]
MTEPDTEVHAVILADDTALTPVQIGLVEIGRSQAFPQLSIGTVVGTTVQVAFGHLGKGQPLENVVTPEVVSALRPRAVLVVGTAEAVRSDVAVGDVVVATDFESQGGVRPRRSSRRAPAPMLERAVAVAGSDWDPRRSDGTPCSVHFRPAATFRDVITLTRPVLLDLGEAAVIDTERFGSPPGHVPVLMIYGVIGWAHRAVDNAWLSLPYPAAENAVTFALSLALTLEKPDLVRLLRTMGHGDRVAETDLLSREAFVESLAELLAHTDENHDLAGPTVIAIEGAWGAGKSTLMEMTRARLESAGPVAARPRLWAEQVSRWRRRKLRAWDADLTLSGWFHRRTREDVTAPRVLTAMFNPWSCQTSEHVWAGLNDCIVSTGAPVIATNSSSSLQRFWFAHNAEQLDRRHVQRTLRKRIMSPLLRLGVFALPVPILAQLARAPETVGLALWLVGVLLGLGLAHTAFRYLVRPADTLLPAELFGPSGAMGSYSTAVGTDDPLRDPHRRTRKGQLQSAQEDVHRLIRELGEQGTLLVVFIDDLDRCSPRTTADVFEAINGFLSGSFPSIRFVLGIDAAATAAHLDAAYSALVVADAGRDSADPSPGWTFLRKLIQLPLPLPRVARTQVEPLLEGLLGTPPRPEYLVVTEEEVAALRGFVPAQPRPEVSRAAVIHTPPTVMTLEHDEKVKQRFAERLAAQPDLSVREAKRIVTVWMFYVRVLSRIDGETGPAAVRRACHLVLLAEIVARWPASQRALHRRVEGVHALTALARATSDTVRWEIEVRRYGLSGDRHRSFREGVLAILRDYDGAEIAKLAEQLT